MVKQLVSLAALMIGMSAGAASAQQCLHGADETPDQAGRRREALTATRMLNTLQANGAGSRGGEYLRHDELAAAPYALKMKQSADAATRRVSLDPLGDILPGWTLILEVAEKRYWFMIKDRTDPCGFAFFSNQDGLIYTAQPLR